MVAVRPEQLELGEAICACERALCRRGTRPSTPSTVSRPKLSGCLLYDRGMVAEALYEIASALIQRRKKWMHAGLASVLRGNLQPILEQARPLVLRGEWERLEGAAAPEPRFFPAY